MSERKLEAVTERISTVSAEIQKLKDHSAELSLRDGPRIPEQQHKTETQIQEKEDELRSLQERQHGLMLRIKKLPQLRPKIKEMEKQAAELNETGLKVLKSLEKHRQKVKRDVDNLRRIAQQFYRLRAVADELKKQVDPEECANVSPKRNFEPPKNAVYFAENKPIYSRG